MWKWIVCVLKKETKPLQKQQLCLFYSIIIHYLLGFCRLLSQPCSKFLCKFCFQNKYFSNVLMMLLFLFSYFSYSVNLSESWPLVSVFCEHNRNWLRRFFTSKFTLRSIYPLSSTDSSQLSIWYQVLPAPRPWHPQFKSNLTQMTIF